jgi:hypothetical protein
LPSAPVFTVNASDMATDRACDRDQWGKGEDQPECGPAKHAPDAEPVLEIATQTGVAAMAAFAKS